MSAKNQFGTEDRLQPSLSCYVEKANGSIQSVCIGEGQRVMALCPNSLAERFQRWNTLHRGIGRMSVQMNEGGGHSMIPPIPDGLFPESRVKFVQGHSQALRPFLFTL